MLNKLVDALPVISIIVGIMYVSLIAFIFLINFIARRSNR